MDVYITVFLIILSLIFRKSRIISTLFFLFMWSLWGFNTWNGDYDAYQYIYENSSSLNSIEVFYLKLNSIFFINGFTFQEFLIIISSLVLFAVYYISIKYSKYPALYSCLYFFIFIMEYVYIRNYISHTLLLIAFFMVIKGVKNYNLWFIILTTIASLIHITSILSFVFILAYKTKKTLKPRRIVKLVIVSAFIFTVILQYASFFLGNYILGKISFYDTGGGISNVFIAFILIVFSNYYFYKTVKSNTVLRNEDKRKLRIIININLVSLFFIIVLFYIPYFSRFLRLLFTFNYIMILSFFVYDYNRVIRLKLNVLFVIITIPIIILFYKSTLSLTLLPLYKSNLVWGVEYYVPDF